MNRCLDLALAVPGVMVAAPLIGALAVAVRLDSPGPAFFTQERVGRGGRPFRLIKLRSMVRDAASRGPAVTAGHDPRITRVGRLLRRTKLDELPQLVNILCGDMSIVGPRPEVPHYVDRDSDAWAEVLSVRPGLTDLASLTFRDEEQILAAALDREAAYTQVLLPLKLSLARRGIARASLVHDLAVIGRTVLAVVRVMQVGDSRALAEARQRIAALNCSLAQELTRA